MRPDRRFPLLTIVLAAVLPVALAHADTNGVWRFAVQLDGSPIGQQTFRLTQDGSRQRMVTEATMDVKILFVTVYSYRHENEETWEGGCLASIESDTDDNGTQFTVRGRRAGDAFVVTARGTRTTLPPCVHTFAYWDPKKLQQTRLLNSQTGEYQAVQFRDLGEKAVSSRGREQPARHVALEGADLRIDLWYAASDGDWLALESKSKGGRTIRYVRE
jgi:hypothetical protein